ncbi:NAD(P)/FAD-dependent oxidoreductase [Salinisphaera sp. T31B1]|uniref:flavin-containing monooxygenase n=1 Tax=Salinisphaera sp. T31B1 TaxID=727963 RepID=UPI00334129A8
MSDPIERHDALVVGAGFAGVYALHRLRTLGLNARAVEAGADVGGTWYWNRYPGARCDTESMQYSYSFSDEIQQEWDWSELYAAQPEILAYINFVVDRLALRDHIDFNTCLSSLRYDAETALWRAAFDDGRQVEATYCVMATGCLSVPKVPDIEGLEHFQGRLLKTSEWPSERPDFSADRVGLIGTGSSGIQTATTIAADCRQLTVFQRTPNYSVPANNRPMSQGYIKAWKSDYANRREQVRQTRNYTLYNNPGQRSGHELTEQQLDTLLEAEWQIGGIGFLYAFNDVTRDREVNEAVARFVRKKIGEIVDDPDTAAVLAPSDYPIGAKRICVDTGYYEIFNHDHVDVVDIKADPVAGVTETGVRLNSGREFELDTLVLATGFDAMTGALSRIDIRGRDDLPLSQEWAAGPKTYLGLMVADFPNLFLVTGPGSPSVFSNMVPSIEEHVDWITETVADLERRQDQTVEPTRDAQEDWMAEVDAVSRRTLMREANSWYLGANVEGKPQVFMPYIGGSAVYARILKQRTTNDMEGFVFR